MTHRIFKAVFGTAILVLLLSVGLIFGVLYEYSSDVSEKQMRAELSLAAEGLEQNGASYLEGLKNQPLRLTWIDADGQVLYDTEETDVSGMENHRNRKEVKEALKSGYGESSRYSSTMTKRMIYAAEKLSDGTVLRIAVTRDSVLSIFFGILQPVCVILILVAVLSIVMALRLSRRIVDPLNRLDLEHPLRNEEYDELSPLLGRIASQQDEIRAQEEKLSTKQKELDTILSSMNEGMILLSADGTVLSMNDAASRVLSVPAEEPRTGVSLLSLTRDLDLIDLADSARAGEQNDRILSRDASFWEVSASPVREDGEAIGAVIVLFDVTDRENAEAMRREFTSNVSHELKTPLHTISGYAELMKDGMADPDDLKSFAEKIYHEAQRMIRLVADIISLSHLDDGAADVPDETADLDVLGREAVSHVKKAAAERGIGLQYEGESVLVRGKVPLLRTIFSNLLDNAVKYNRDGGRILLSVHGISDSGEESEENHGNHGNRAEIIVRDTGIGIPKADQKRIFERFYRVDKSHSREIGGTGLGLSIVKHAVQIHHGTIAVDSEPGKGTTFTVSIPAEEK